MISLIICRVGSLLLWIGLIGVVLTRDPTWLFCSGAGVLGFALHHEAADDYLIMRRADRLAKLMGAKK